MPTESGFQVAMLEALVDFHAALHFVLGLAFFPGQLDAAHAAIAQVDQVQVIDEAAKEAGPAGRIRTHPVTLQGEELFIGMGMLQACRQEGCGENEGF